MKKPKIGPYELEKLEAKFTRQSVSKSVDNNFTLYNNKCVVRRVVDGDLCDMHFNLWMFRDGHVIIPSEY
jgi:hypothetical protein